MEALVLGSKVHARPRAIGTISAWYGHSLWVCIACSNGEYLVSMASCADMEFGSAEYLSSMSCRTGSRFGVATHIPLEKVAPTIRTIYCLQCCGPRCLGRILLGYHDPSTVT